MKKKKKKVMTRHRDIATENGWKGHLPVTTYGASHDKFETTCFVTVYIYVYLTCTIFREERIYRWIESCQSFSKQFLGSICLSSLRKLPLNRKIRKSVWFKKLGSMVICRCYHQSPLRIFSSAADNGSGTLDTNRSRATQFRVEFICRGSTVAKVNWQIE